MSHTLEIIPTQRPMRIGLIAKSALLGSLLCTDAYAELHPNTPPGGNFALENWNITIPVDSTGGVTGKPLTIYPAKLSGPNGYSNRPYFYTEADGAMTMWAPLNGATTGGSAHPRSELREMIDPSTNAVNWDSFGTAILDAQLKVMQVPQKDGTVIVGQVHGHGSAPLVLVYYKYDFATQTGKVFTKLQGTPVQGPPYWHYTILSDVKLGQTFTYQIKVSRNGSDPAVVAVSANNGTPATMVMDSSWDTETFYFKAGSYLHTYGDSSTDGALVKFYRLATSHPADGLYITTNAALPNAKANTPYSTQLSFRGGMGGGTWSLVSGHPPAGLTLNRDGSITGTPATSAISSQPNDFMVRVTDANGATYSKKFSIVVGS
ncbi:polysaccharide lyase family 7 protein [Pseudomonas indica]|uniref:polysaccharide lyase family 7 protein n=1 Tax=Pseudomonas indica TaxID=137658 RepID=UPI0023F6BD21|nr:polysaccharide lyase family 7 protein [Pseudomonas indica]